MAWYRPITPKYRNSNTSSEVRRASQVHQVPQVGLPQIEPVTKVIKVNAAPIGALAIASTSDNFIRHTRAMNPFAAMNRYANRLIHALGTCTYMMRNESPCW